MDTHSTPYGDQPSWTPERPRIRPLRLVVTWFVSASALLVAAAIVPHVAVKGFLGAIAAAALIALLNAVLPPIVAALRLPFALVTGFLLVLLARRDDAGGRVAHRARCDPGRLVLVGAPGRTPGIGRDPRARRHLRHERRRHLFAPRRATHRTTFGRPSANRCARDHLPRDRRSGPPRPAPGDARRQRACDGEVGAGQISLAAGWETDFSSQTGASQAGILLGSNEDISAFRWVEKERGVMMVCSAPADCTEIERRHATGKGLLIERRRKSRQSPLGRSRPRDPDRQPHPGGARREPGLPRVPRERVQRDAGARAADLGGDPRVACLAPRDPPRRQAARASRWRLSAPARGHVRLRPRPARVRRPDGHDEGPARRVRHVLELRRGRTSLRPRARRHARGVEKAR